MTTPTPEQPLTGPAAADTSYHYQRHEDRRKAAELASEQNDGFTSWEQRADTIYAWLRAITEPASLTITPGTPQLKSSEEPQ